MEKYMAHTKEEMMEHLIAENLRLKRIIRCLIGEDTTMVLVRRDDLSLALFQLGGMPICGPNAATARNRLKAALHPDEQGMWHHHCPVEGHIAVGKGEECNWCGAKKDSA